MGSPVIVDNILQERLTSMGYNMANVTRGFAPCKARLDKNRAPLATHSNVQSRLDNAPSYIAAGVDTVPEMRNSAPSQHEPSFNPHGNKMIDLNFFGMNDNKKGFKKPKDRNRSGYEDEIAELRATVAAQAIRIKDLEAVNETTNKNFQTMFTQITKMMAESKKQSRATQKEFQTFNDSINSLTQEVVRISPHTTGINSPLHSSSSSTLFSEKLAAVIEKDDKKSPKIFSFAEVNDSGALDALGTGEKEED